mgnify:CR=1 FL=1
MSQQNPLDFGRDESPNSAREPEQRTKLRPPTPVTPEQVQQTWRLVFVVAVVGTALLAAIAAACFVPEMLTQWELKQEAREWGRKGVVMPEFHDDYRDFRHRYKREFGHEWDSPAAVKD